MCEVAHYDITVANGVSTLLTFADWKVALVHLEKRTTVSNPVDISINPYHEDGEMDPANEIIQPGSYFFVMS